MPSMLLWIEYGRFTIAGPAAGPGTQELPYGNGLVAATTDPPGGAVIVTGLADGQVKVTAELLSAEPQASVEEWEDAAVIGVRWPGGSIRVIGADVIPASELTFTQPLPQGPLCLLVAGRNRDAGEEREPHDPVEEYLILAWPSPAGEADRTLKAASRTGAYWRKAQRRKP